MSMLSCVSMSLLIGVLVTSPFWVTIMTRLVTNRTLSSRRSEIKMV